MGKFDFNVPQEFIDKLERMQDSDVTTKKILKATVPILKRQVKKECEKHARTRSMVDSVDATNVKKNKIGWYVSVRPTGVDEKGVRNMEKMAHAEFGTSKQTATPILSKAIADCRDECLEKMIETYKEIVESGG